MKTESTQPIELPPELSAVEARLAAIRPETDAASRERTKTAVLLESCELVRQGQFSLSREKLVETIVKSGEPEITLSLQQYTKTLRTHSTLNGLLIGVIVGIAFGLVGTLALVQLLRPPQPPVIQHHYYQNVIEGSEELRTKN